MACLDLLNDGAELAGFGFIDDIGVIDTDDRLVRRDFDHIEVVDAAKFLFLGERRASHAGELAVQTEEVLECDGGKGLVFARDGNALLGLNRLMEALVVAPTVHQSAGKLVDNDDLTVFDHVVDVLFHEAARLHGLIDVVRKRGILRVS